MPGRFGLWAGRLGQNFQKWRIARIGGSAGKLIYYVKKMVAK